MKDYEQQVTAFKDCIDEEFHKQIVSQSCCGEKSAEVQEGLSSFVGDGHLLVCTALGYGVLYQNVARNALLDASFLPGIKSALDNDALLCACVADIELDGFHKLFVGTYSGRVLVYEFFRPIGVVEDADNPDDRSTNVSPLNSISSGGFSADPVQLSSSIQETFGNILQPFPGETPAFTNGLRERLECIESDSSSKLSNPARGESITELRDGTKLTELSVAGSLNSETGYLTAQMGRRTESPIPVSSSSSPIPVLHDVETNTTHASRVSLAQFPNTNSNMKRSLERETSLPVTPSSGKAIKPAPWNDDGSHQGSGTFRRVESEKDVRNSMRYDVDRDYRKIKNDLGIHFSYSDRSIVYEAPASIESSDQEDRGWMSKSDRQGGISLSYVFHAGGPVLGMYWVDLTRDGLRDLVIVIHDGVRVLQCEMEYVVHRLREKLALLHNLRSLENEFLDANRYCPSKDLK